jgi:hypothetical protein
MSPYQSRPPFRRVDRSPRPNHGLAMPYVTAFDAAEAPYFNLGLQGPGVMLAGSAIAAFRPGWLKRLGFGRLFDRPDVNWLGLAFAICWLSTVSFFLYRSAAHARELAASGRCRTVEGQVANFHPMPYGGHARERFDVDGVPFSYSDFEITGAFNTSAAHGGPIRDGLPVRICHLDGLILRLDVTRP